MAATGSSPGDPRETAAPLMQVSGSICRGTDIKMKDETKMQETQIQNLLKQSPEQRYDYLIRYCVESQQVWGLSVGDDNWIISKEAEGDEVFPLWPHQDLASACCFEEHQQMGAKPKAISLQSFLDNCVPDMISEGVLFGVFYDKKRSGLVVEADVLRAEIEDEIKARR